MDENTFDYQLLENYIKEHYVEIHRVKEDRVEKKFAAKKSYKKIVSFGAAAGLALASPLAIADINFRRMQAEKKSETFSEMLKRLIEESGEKNSAVYNRANIDRRHFSKIINHPDYQPSKQTALAFAISLKLDFDATQKILATAGFTLNNTSLSDVIISFFIEYKIFNVNLINQTLYKYNLPMLGG